jgi:hypothetical protein
VLKARTNFYFTKESLVEYRITFGLRVRHLDRDNAAIAGIDSAEDRCHAGCGHQAFELVLIELIAGVQGRHRNPSR